MITGSGQAGPRREIVSEDPRDPERRRAELRANLERLEDRIRLACRTAGRPRAEVTAIVVTKTFPASDVVLLAALGVRDVGEARDQEARAKIAEVGRLAAADGLDLTDLRWHAIGRLQTNKARSVGRWADVVHSVDRLRLVAPVARGAEDAARQPLDVLVQVSLDEHLDDDLEAIDEGPNARARGGAASSDAVAVAEAVAAEPALRLRGVMGIAPLDADPGPAFARLVAVGEGLRRAHPDATWVSAGMSADLEKAIRAGATHLRVGSAVLGSRPRAR